MKVVFDEPKTVGRKICSKANVHPTQFFFIQHDYFFSFFIFTFC